MGKFESSKRSLEGFGRAQELGNNPEGIRPTYFSYDDTMDQADETMRAVNEVDLPTNEIESNDSLIVGNYSEYMELLVQTKMLNPEKYEEYLARVLEKLADSSITETSVRQYVDEQVQIANLKSNIGKFFG